MRVKTPCISDLRDVVDGIDFETPCGDLCAIKRHTELIILVEKKKDFQELKIKIFIPNQGYYIILRSGLVRCICLAVKGMFLIGSKCNSLSSLMPPMRGLP